MQQIETQHRKLLALLLQNHCYNSYLIKKLKYLKILLSQFFLFSK